MQTITNIIQEINKKTKLPQEQIKKVLTAFLELTKQKLNQGENISFKGYFTFKRGSTQPKGTKNCSKHEKSLLDFKQANKGKGLAVYFQSPKFKKLIQETKNCKDCQTKKQQLAKSVKPTNRINLKPSESF
jgi:nucleoid DNA-binding protein